MDAEHAAEGQGFVEPHPHAGRPRSPSADNAILDAATALLAEVGYRAMSMEGVAARAGVSKATLYRRYGDKAELVTGVLLHVTGGTMPHRPMPLPGEPATSAGPFGPGGPPFAGPSPFGPGGRPFAGGPPFAGPPPFGPDGPSFAPGAPAFGPGGPSASAPGRVSLAPAGSTREILTFALKIAATAAAGPAWLPVLGAMLAESPHEGGLADAVRTQVFEPSNDAIRTIVEAGIARGELRPTASPEVIGDVLFGALVARSMLGAEISDAWIEGVVAAIWDGAGAEPRPRDQGPR